MVQPDGVSTKYGIEPLPIKCHRERQEYKPESTKSQIFVTNTLIAEYARRVFLGTQACELVVLSILGREIRIRPYLCCGT